MIELITAGASAPDEQVKVVQIANDVAPESLSLIHI